MADQRRRHNNSPQSGDPTEGTPLLHEDDHLDQDQDQVQDQHPHQGSSPASSIHVHVPKAHRGSAVVNVLCLIILVATSATGFIAIPFTRLAEDVLCRRYYGVEQQQQQWGGGGPGADAASSPIDEGLCKENSIQGRLAFIMAINSALEAVASLLAAFPWGLAADRIGRRPVSAIALGSMVVALLWAMVVVSLPSVLPIELVWLGAASPFVGGGNAVLAGVVLSMIADATREEERAVAFMRLHAASLCGNLMSPALSSLLMSRAGGPWPSLWVAVALLSAAALSFFVFLPETLTAPTTSTKRAAPSATRCMRESLSMLLRRPRSLVLLLASALGAAPALFATLQFMAQFASRRYGLRLAQTGYVQSGYGAAQIVQALVVLPLVSRWWRRRQRSPSSSSSNKNDNNDNSEHRCDLSLALWSYAVLVLGVVVLGASPRLGGFVFGLALTALGSGFGSLSKSLMSLYVDAAQRSRLFSLVGVVEVLGGVYAHPMLAGLFALGMELGGGWIGLPYYGLAVLVAACGSLLLFVRLPESAAAGELPELAGEEDPNYQAKRFLSRYSEDI
ncbi:major facilitator superfamily domain-containing protein [Biscogniauxia mediterranea]|nr:major facilitator superfamily domain-containing protein [Biscogniauxia mediterranea]